MSLVFRLREVVHSPRYDQELEEIERDPQAADQATHAAEFLLAREPERGARAFGTRIHGYPVMIERREYVVFYIFDDDRVELLSIVPGPPELEVE